MSRVEWQLTAVAARTWAHWSGRVANGSWLTGDCEAGYGTGLVVSQTVLGVGFVVKVNNLPVSAALVYNLVISVRVQWRSLDGSSVCGGFFFPPEKVHGVHQLSSPAGDEEWEIRPGLQTVPEDDPSGQSQACYPGQQLSSSQVGAVLIASSLQLEPTGSSPQPPYFSFINGGCFCMIAFNQDTQWCVIMFSLGDLGRKDSPGADRLQKGIFKKTWNLYPRYVIFNLCYGNCKRWSYTLIYSSTSLKDLFMWCALTRLCRLCCYRSRFIIFQQEIRDWVLRHAGQDRCPPLQWKQHWARHSLRKILQGVHTGNYWPRWVSVWMKHCCDPGQTPHTGGDPDLIVLPQRCSVAFAFYTWIYWSSKRSWV